MAYADQEGSIQDGTPYFLYEFVTPDETFRYTDYPETVVWNSQDWLPFPIKHNEVKQSNELSKNSMTVSIPIMENNTFVDIFLGWSPDYSVSYTLRRGHFGASDTLVYWKGRIASHNLKQQTIELKCESIFTSMRRPGIRARYQRQCRHALYSAGCGVDKDAFATAGSITSVTGLILTVPAAAGEANNYFTGGAIEFPGGSFRMITAHTGDQITISRANRYVNENFGLSGWGLSWGQFWGGFGVTLYPGCDRSLSTCLNKFNNILNNGGFKWIPSKNPMGGSSIV